MTLILKLANVQRVVCKAKKPWTVLPRRCYIQTYIFRSANSSKKKITDLKHIKRFVAQNSRLVSDQKIKGKEFQKLFSLAKPEKWKLCGAIGFLIISSSVTMAVPFCLGKIIDLIFTTDREKSRDNLNKVSLILLGICIVGGISNFARVYLMSMSGYRITQNLRQKAYSAILSQEAAMFDKVSTGELVGRLSGINFQNCILKNVSLSFDTK